MVRLMKADHDNRKADARKGKDKWKQLAALPECNSHSAASP